MMVAFARRWKTIGGNSWYAAFSLISMPGWLEIHKVYCMSLFEVWQTLFLISSVPRYCHKSGTRFYGLPKVHKAGAPLRPIVASRGSITYHVARKVADILAPMVGNNGYALKNSSDLVTQMSEVELDEDEIRTSLSTSIKSTPPSSSQGKKR